MPPTTYTPRVRVILSRRFDGAGDEGGAASGRPTRSASFTVHGVESEEWLLQAFLNYLRYLQANGYPDIEIKQNQTARNSQSNQSDFSSPSPLEPS